MVLSRRKHARIVHELVATPFVRKRDSSPVAEPRETAGSTAMPAHKRKNVCVQSA